MQRMDQLTILKLGGSAITDKGRECTPDIPAIQRIADQLRDYNLPLILIHGGGFYAHPLVTRSDINPGPRGPSHLRSTAEAGVYLKTVPRLICAVLLLRYKLAAPFPP